MACLYVLFCVFLIFFSLFTGCCCHLAKVAMITDMFLKVFAIAWNWEGASWKNGIHVMAK